MNIHPTRHAPYWCCGWIATNFFLSIGFGQDFSTPQVDIAPSVPFLSLPSNLASEGTVIESGQVDEDRFGIGENQNADNSEGTRRANEIVNHSFDIGYDNGVYFRAREGNDSFELKTNVRSQFRFVNFSRNETSWTDNAGEVNPVDNRRYFDIERLRTIVSGHVFTPKLKYLLQADSDTDSAHVTSVLDGWAGWKFSDTFEVQLGKRKVPGTRNWLLGAFDTRMVDRSFANEFFRPSRTTGIWFVRDPSESSHYEFMIGQGYNTEGLVPSELGSNFSVGASAWRDVIGSYGPARPTDFEFHDELAVRLGTSIVTSTEGKPGRQLEETDFLRLTDGTRLTSPNALAPGATVESFQVSLLAVDAAFKYRGWSANGEYFVRRVDDLKANLPVPTVGWQHGFYVEGGMFLIQKKLEWNSQYAFVNGKQGATNSYATGFSYYPRGAQHLKLSIDATYIDGSPVNSTASDIFVGDDGVLVRTQFQVVF